MAVTYDFAALVGLYTAIAAVVDVRQHRIPNWVTVPAAVLGVAYHSLMPNGLGLGMSLAGFAIGFCLLLLPWLLGGGGMGDVKLLAALGAWLGPWLMLAAFAISAFMAAVIALGVIVASTFQRGISRTKQRYLESPADDKKTRPGTRKKKRRVLPFAVPVALATWLLVGWFVLKHSLGLQ